MAESYRALVSDSYVNLKLALKMELPRTRETVLELFERVRRQFPALNSFRRMRDELALEAAANQMPHRWVAVKGNTLRAGVVNAESAAGAYDLHTMLLETAPHYLSISPLDIDHVELLYGFDMLASGNHDAVVFDAFYGGSPIGRMMEIPGATPLECQPSMAFSLGGLPGGAQETGAPVDTEVGFEVKTRSNQRPQPAVENPEAAAEPISVYLTLRRFGPVESIDDLGTIFKRLARQGEELVRSRVIPNLLVPLRDAISSGNQ